MKRVFYAVLLMTATLFLASCEPAEQEYTVEQFYSSIYTVNKSTLSPEFSDSAVVVSNIADYGLQTGDRAHMILRYYFDYATMKKPQVTVHQLVEVIPTLSLSSKESVDTVRYSTPFNKLHQYEFHDRYAQPIWIWKNRLNMNISYFGLRDGADFAMSVRDVKDGCVELDLRADANRVGNATTTRLLTYDLSNVADFFTEDQKKSVADMDSLKTRIFFDREENGSIKKVNIVGGNIANPIK